MHVYRNDEAAQSVIVDSKQLLIAPGMAVVTARVGLLQN